MIVVRYEVLAHVIDVEAAMAADAPVLHADLFTKGINPKPTVALNVAEKTVLGRGNVAEALGKAHLVIERRVDGAGPSGLHRTPCLRGVGALMASTSCGAAPRDISRSGRCARSCWASNCAT